MRRGSYGYFNPEPPEVITVPAPPAGASKRVVAKTAKKVRRFGQDLITVNQILGGMFGFAGTNTLTSVLEHYLPYNQIVSRAISGGLIYGAAWFFVSRSSGMAASKAELKKAVLFGIVLNIALSFLTSGVSTLKSAVGMGEYLNQSPSPQNLHPGEGAYAEEYSYQ